MKQKLFYLVPLILVLLCLTPFALHKDTVGFSGKTPVFSSLAPSHWRLLQFDVSASINLSQTSDTTSTAEAAKSSNPPLSTGAHYKGFPFGAYFEVSGATNSSGSTSSSDISAWSPLWAAADGLLIVIAFLGAMKLNRRTVSQPASAAPDPANVPASSEPAVFSPSVVSAPAQPVVPPGVDPFTHLNNMATTVSPTSDPNNVGAVISPQTPGQPQPVEVPAPVVPPITSVDTPAPTTQAPEPPVAAEPVPPSDPSAPVPPAANPES